MSFAVYESHATNVYADRPDDCGCSCARLGEIGCTAARIALSVTCIALTIIFGGCFVATGNPAFLGLTLASAIAAIVAWPFWGRGGAHEAAAPMGQPYHRQADVVVHHQYAAPVYTPPAPLAFYSPQVPPAAEAQRHAGVGDHRTPGLPPPPQPVYAPPARSAFYSPPVPLAAAAADPQRHAGVEDHQTPGLPPPYVIVVPPQEATPKHRRHDERSGVGDHRAPASPSAPPAPGVSLGYPQAILLPPGGRGMGRVHQGSHAPEAAAVPPPFDPTGRAGVGDGKTPLRK